MGGPCTQGEPLGHSTRRACPRAVSAPASGRAGAAVPLCDRGWCSLAVSFLPGHCTHRGPHQDCAHVRSRAALCLRHQPQRQTGRDAPHTLAGTPVRFPALFLVQSTPAAVVQVLPTPTARMGSGLSPHTLGDPGRAQPSLPRVFHGSLSSICKPHLHPDTHAHCCLGPLTAPTPVPHSRGLPRADSRVLLLT